jgi:hypothetical protein
MKKTFASITAIAVASAAFALTATPAQASGPAFTCDAVTYQVIANQLKIGTVDPSTSPASLTYTNVGAAYSESYNGGGYNVVDNYIYAMSATSQLLRIASDGSVETLSVPTGLPLHTFPAGDVTPDGQHLVVVDSTDKSVWSIDLINVSATNIGSLPSSPSQIDMGDFAIVTSATTVTAYGLDTTTGALVSFDPTQNPITVHVNSTVSIYPNPSGAKGAVWTDATGNLTTFVNATGEVFGITDPSSASPTVSLLAVGTTAFGNDGMKCGLSASAFEPGTSASAGSLPSTGIDAAGAVSLAVTLLLAGIVGIAGLAGLTARRRSRRA